MKTPAPEPQRGEAAWRAELKEITQRNDAARAAGQRRRAAKNVEAAERAAHFARREALDYPKPMGTEGRP